MPYMDRVSRSKEDRIEAAQLLSWPKPASEFRPVLLDEQVRTQAGLRH